MNENTYPFLVYVDEVSADHSEFKVYYPKYSFPSPIEIDIPLGEGMLANEAEISTEAYIPILTLKGYSFVLWQLRKAVENALPKSRRI